jgi:mannosyltransferase
VTDRVWLLPALVTLVFGLAYGARPELWRDELRSWSAASRSIGDLFHLLHNTDAAVALYYLVLHYWIAVFGDSPLSLRSPSIIAMAGAAAMVSLIGRRLFDARAGLVAGLLFAVIPNVSRFAQEARPYAITLFVAGLATVLFLRAVERPSWSRSTVYGLSVAVLIAMQVVMALPLLVVHAVGALLWARRDRLVLVKLAVVVLCGVLLASPVIVLSHSQYNHQVGSLPPATLTELSMFPARLFASGLVAGLVVAFALAAFRRDRWRPYVFAACLALLPPAAVWLVSKGPDSYWMTRYTLVALLGFAVLAGAGAAVLRLPMAGAIAVVIVALLGIPDQRALREVNSHDIWDYPDPNPEFLNYSGLAATLAAHMQPGDGIVYSERNSFWLADIGIAYHLRGQPQPVDVFVQTTALQRGDFWPAECEPIASCAPTQQRLWLVSTDWAWEQDPFKWMDKPKADLLQPEYHVAARYTTVPIGNRYADTQFGLVLTLLVRN